MIADLAILGVVVISGLLAFARGLVHEVLSVAAWVGAFFAALYGFNHLAPFVREWISVRLIADLATAAGLFIITLMVLSMLSHAVSRRTRESALGALDRSLGFLFGLARGVVAIALAYLLFAWVVPPADHPDWVRDAKSRPAVEATAAWLCALGPQRISLECNRVLALDAPATGSDTERALRELIEPRAKATAPPDKSGYDERQRREMDRLIQSTE